jgi:hypothetical protein
VVDVVALARTHTEAAIQTLAECLRDPRHKVQAAAILLDRAWGRPTQPLAGDADAGPVHYVFSWASAQPETDAPVIDAAASTDADDTHSPAPLTLVWESEG